MWQKIQTLPISFLLIRTSSFLGELLEKAETQGGLGSVS